jgi:hypothetical protein
MLKLRPLAFIAAFILTAVLPVSAAAQHSVARQWNEVLLNAIRVDFARPTVHARNLFNTAVVMYDAWAAYDGTARPYMLGTTRYGFTMPFYGMPTPSNLAAARDEAVSYAAYRLLRHRFALSPGAGRSLVEIDSLMTFLGYDRSFTSTDYAGGSAAALGNYIAQQMIAYGTQDGSNEQDGYANRYYKPVNPPLTPTVPGNATLVDPNRWQPLTLNFIDQSGNPIPVSTPPFLSPEWGKVHPFSMGLSDLTIRQRDGYDWWLYHDPGDPPYLDTLATGGLSEEYKWGFALDAVWSSHLDPTDGVLWDISPGASGNNPALPSTIPAYRNYYDLINGGDPGSGWATNPRTGQPYAPQVVPRGDYTRVLAEFWADGPESETPPGHWFTILNYVNDHPLFQRRFMGQGAVIAPLEWDVKAYLIMGGAMHDCAVSAWGIKGLYDYTRPISAIRGMAERGQSSDPQQMSYDPGGLPLIPGYIEVVLPGDPLAGAGDPNVGKIKLKAWQGPSFITDPETDTAGVDWILAANWWPYQRPTFITPPFAGYVSGHSTFSRAAAEIMTLLTGDEFFPGGLGEFQAPRNQFLVFEEGPSVDLTLQWATYRDASDQTSLSRIWGGIHPPADDIPGRAIGLVIGPEAFAYARTLFDGSYQEPRPPIVARSYPNPVGVSGVLTVELDRAMQDVTLNVFNVQGRLVHTERRSAGAQRFLAMNTTSLESGLYFLQIKGDGWEAKSRVAVIR